MATREKSGGTSNEHGSPDTPILDKCIEVGGPECSTVPHESPEGVDSERSSIDDKRPEGVDSNLSNITGGGLRTGPPIRPKLEGTSMDEHGLIDTPILDESIQGNREPECSSTVIHESPEGVDSERSSESITDKKPDGGDSGSSTITDGDLEGEEAEYNAITDEKRNQECSSTLKEMQRISLSDQTGLEDRSSCSFGDRMLLLPEILDRILAHCDFSDVFRSRVVCDSFRDVIKRKTFQQTRGLLFPTECYLCPLVFYVADDKWRMLGFDYEEQIWRKLPPLEKPIPIPDTDLFKDFHVSEHGGLFCVNVGRPTESEKIYVFNPLTGLTREIPPLKFPRHPVVLNLHVTRHVTLAKSVDTISSSYRIIAIGSAATGTESLSRKTEIYDSVKEKWESARDAPGTDFSINEPQTGVYCESENVLLMTGFMVDCSKGILAFDVKKREWREDLLCPYFQYPGEDNALPVHFAITQLVECSGAIYLFSEQEAGRQVTHCIDRLDLISGGGFTWTRKLTRQRQGYRALLVYPEYTCVPVKENKLCIFNTIDRTGVVYNMLDDPINPDVYESIPATPPLEDGVVFHSLNPVGYAYEPSFGVSV